VRLVSGFFRTVRERKIREGDTDARLVWLLIVGTIPAGLVGLLFKHFIRVQLLSGYFAAIFLALNGVLLFVAEILRRKAPLSDAASSDQRISKMSWWQGFKVGLMQVLALMPGFSRTGSTIAGSLIVGLSHEDAVRYSFLLSTPIIAAAAALELPKLIASGNFSAIGVSVAGGICAALFSFLSVKFLTAYFKTENRKLTPFAVYCLAFGLAALLLHI